jgi:hypothetical protein
MSVVIAWRTGKNAHARTVKAGGEVTQALRSYAQQTLSTINDGAGHPYDPNGEQDDDHAYLEASTDELLDTALLAEIRKGASLHAAVKEDFQRPLALYAVVAGADPENLVAFVRRGNPVQLAKKGLVAAAVDQTLTRVADALFAFDRQFDLVIYPSTVHILHQNNFEALFKESEAVLAKTAEWARQLADSIPMSDVSSQRLAARIRGNSIMRRRVLSIIRSDYLSSLTPALLRQKIEEHGMDPAKMLEEDGNLIVSADTEKSVLQLLNEDLWTGDFSGAQYASSKKSKR